MVYRHVMILKGFEFEIDDVINFIIFMANIWKKHNVYEFLQTNFSNMSMTDKKEWLTEHFYKINNNVLNNFGIKIFSPPCCSKIGWKKFIIGRCIKKYDRVNVKCKNCDKYSCCDFCIGITENGYYDVQNILNGLVGLDNNHICEWCYNDKRNDTECKFCEFPKKGYVKYSRHKLPEIFDCRTFKKYVNVCILHTFLR